MNSVHALAFERDRDDRPHEDHFVVLHDVTWPDYERILEVRGDHSSPRIAYLEGELEIMSPSLRHEWIKSVIGSLVEIWCIERRVVFSRVGSWTLKDRKVARGVEPDECFIFSPSLEVQRPHLAVEVVWTSGSIDKLEIYRKLGVAEVWIWRRGVLTPHVLRGATYEAVTQSEVLPGIDLRQLASVLDQPNTSAALDAYRELLRKG